MPVFLLFAVEFRVKVVIERVRPDGIPTTNAGSHLGEQGESSQQEVVQQIQADEGGGEKVLYRTNLTLEDEEGLCTNDTQTQMSEESYVQCRVCNESFCTRGNLTRHVRVHERGTEKCVECGALFTHKATLSKHIKKMHNTEN